MSTELSIVIPTYNERSNIEPMIAALESVLQDVSWEVVFVDDDSPDGTAAEVRRIARTCSHVRCIQRLQRRGLSSACLEGMLSTSSRYMAVMDGDMQHDESLLPEMLARIRQQGVDLVVGSRYAAGGSPGALDRRRASMSKLANRLGKIILRVDITDPMSGYFMIRREYLEECMRNATGIGFKILLDLIASGKRPPGVVELPYTMRRRRHGESKLDALVVVEYLYLLLNKLFGRFVSNRFVMFAIVGLSGVFVHLGTLAVLHRVFGQTFLWAQVIATMVAMTSNYVLNNRYTYYDRKLRGRRFVKGLFSFYLACGVGALINVVFAEFLYEQNVAWAIAGAAGALVGALWNYMSTSRLTWGGKAMD